MIGRGTYGFGAVWVAKKAPDGHIHGHANQARITVDWDLGSEDVIDFAIEHGVCLIFCINQDDFVIQKIN